MEFDPYHKWLGIPVAEQPPNHYRLLAIALFESDQDVIETAADQRMALLRTFQGGPHSALSQKLLNEVSAARLCLLTPDEKQAYDAALRGRPAGVALQGRIIPHALPVEAALSPPMESSAIETVTRPLFVADREPPRSRTHRRRKGVGPAGAACLLLAAVAIPAFGFVAYLISTKPEAAKEFAQTGPSEKSRPGQIASESDPGPAPAPAGGEEAASGEPAQSHLSGVDGKAARQPADASCFNGRFYKVFPDKVTWDEARTRCNQMGGRLVVIKSQAENSFVTQLASEAQVDGVWLGATDRAKEGQWEWCDGASVQYNCWDTGQPNNMRRVEHYAVLLVRKAGKWWDYPNDPTEHLDITGPAKPAFICEWQSTESAGAQPDDNTVGVEILDADRRAAEYVLSVGGHVAINGQLDGQGKWRSDVKERIIAASDLPREAFHLTGVGLKGNRRVTETGLTAFRGTKHLVALNLAGCSGISEESFANFQGNFERDRKLALLVLSETAVGDAGLSCLRECSELRRLDVTRTKVTAEGVKSLKRDLPQCKITWDGGEITLIEPDVAAAPSRTSTAEVLLPLFNSKDLAGWKTHATQPSKWRVENGVLIGDGPGDSYLYSERGDYKDFHLRAEVRISEGGNAGIYARSGFGPTGGAKWPGGYEAQIGGGDGKTGSVCKGLELVCSAADSPAKPNEWFTLELFAIDNHVIVKVNGQRTGIYTDNDRTFPEGHIALQHDPQTTVEFRKIEIREHSRADKGKFPLGRYVRIELPRTGTINLAEVEVYSGGRNIARAGKATQKNTSWGGNANRGIDGNKSGVYGDGGQTHTEENTAEPWWELDLGGMHPIESIAVYCRTEGTLNKWLDGFTLRIVDAARHVVAERTGIPAPEVSARYEINVGADGAVSVGPNGPRSMPTSVAGQPRKLPGLSTASSPSGIAKLTATEAFSLNGHPGAAVTRVKFHPTLPLLVSSGKDGRVLLWDLRAKAKQAELGKFDVEVCAVKFSLDGSVVTFGHRHWWQARLFFKTLAGQPLPEVKGFKHGGGAVASIAYSPDGRLLAAGSDDGTIRLWDVTQSQEFPPVGLGGRHNVYNLAFGPITFDRKRQPTRYLLAEGGEDGEVRTLAITKVKNKPPWAFKITPVKFPKSAPVAGLRFSPDGKLLGASRRDGNVALYDPENGGQPLRVLTHENGSAEWIAFHPQRPWCVTAHKEQQVARIWNFETGGLHCELKGHTGGVLCAEFSPDGRRVATASEDFSIRLWELSGAGLPASGARTKNRKPTPLLVGE